MRNASLEQIVASYLPTYLKQPAGSAASSKGLLAVAAACAGEGAAQSPPKARNFRPATKPYRGMVISSFRTAGAEAPC
jgi:hypothetical protein